MSYVRVSIMGTFTGGEVWSINPCFDPTLEFPGGVNQTQLDAATALIANRSIPTSLRTVLTASGSRTAARVEVREDSNDALIGISTQGSTAAMPGTGSVSLPYQSAVVFSLRTNTPGGSGRGRVYWPLLFASLNTSGKIVNPLPATLLTDMKGYLLGIRSDLAASFPTIGFDLAVRSKTTHTTPHVVRLQVGDAVDTQRRRRDAVIEQYVETSFP